MQGIHDREHSSFHKIEDDMQDWITKVFSSDWKVYYLKNCIETYLFEHRCGGAVSHLDNPKECSMCKEPLPGKFLMVIQMVLKKDLIRV